MTVVDIALAANVSRRTVSRVAAKLFPGKMANGHRTTFSKEEAIHLMGELRKPGFVSVGKQPGQNGQAPRQNGQVAQARALPSGAQLSVMLKAYGPKELAKRLDFVIGYQDAQVRQVPVQQPLGLEEAGRVPSEQLARDLRSMIPAKAVARS